MGRFWQTAVVAGLGAMGLMAAAAIGAPAPVKPAAKPAAVAKPATKPAARTAASAARPVNTARIVNQKPGEWLSHGRGYDEQRYSPLDQINLNTVKDLKLAWYADLGSTRGVEGTPLMVDGVLYNIQPWNITTAYDAKTGKELWKYDPKVPESTGRYACCDIDARGLAAWNGKIIVPTLDGRLIALNAKTGKPVWSVQTLDEKTPWPYTVTGAPRVFDGKVIIGNAGGEVAAQGYMTAYDAETGKKLWRFYIVPGDPKVHPWTEADKMAAKTWADPEFWKTGGGGNNWDAIVYDPKAKLVYIGTGNGGPWYPDYRGGGKGDNLFISSIVALHVEDGSYAWHYQVVPGDKWDFDNTAPLMLADLTIDGKLRHVIMQAPKVGFFYVLDRITGEVISAKDYVPQNWNIGFEPKTWRPIINPAVDYKTDKPILVMPNSSHNWQPMAYSPRTGLVYFPVNEGGRIIAKDPDFKVTPGSMSQLGILDYGDSPERKALQEEQRRISKSYLIAYDPVKQQAVWKAPYKRGGNGGVLATAGDLVFEGTAGATFAAYNARTGEKVWEMPVQQSPISGPISYEIDGEQYVAVNAGFGGGLAHDGQMAADPSLQLYDYGRLLVFKLNGKAALPPFKRVVATLDPPPQVQKTNGQVIEGMKLYAKNCQGCHGENLRGGIKDLRRMSKETHAEFFDIVLGGKRQAKGMANFSNVLSRNDAELIRKYIIARIEEDWTDLKNGKQ
jgi:quinohemoprotein ethanol dehydrogenase